jgi:hypothetical protein
MTPSIILEYIMLLCSRSKLQAPLGRYVEAAKVSLQWLTLESTLTLVGNGLGSLPSMQGASMVTLLRVTWSIIVASTVLAPVYTPGPSVSSQDEESQPEIRESSNTNVNLSHD